MSVRTKVLLIVGACVLILETVTLSLIYFALTREAKRAETAMMEGEARRLHTAISYELAGLRSTTHDYATWDDTYAYVKERQPDYIETNYVADTFITNNFSMVLLYDVEGRLAFSQARSLASGAEEPISQTLLSDERIKGIVSDASGNHGVEGILGLPNDGVWLLAAQPILTSQGEGPPGGVLVFLRPLNEDMVRQLAEATGLALTFRMQDIASLTRVPPASDTKPEVDIHLQHSKSDLAGDVIIRDMSGAGVAVIRILESRDYYVTAISFVRMLILLVAASSAIFFLTLIVVLDRVILARLVEVCKFIGGLKSTGQLAQRLTLSGNDEISDIAGHLNAMLNHLALEVTEKAASEEAVRESEERLRAFIEQTHEGITIIDEEGRIIEWNPSASEISGLAREEVMGCKFWDVQILLVPEERRSGELHERLKGLIKNALQTGMPTFHGPVEKEIQRPDGSRRLTEQSLFRIKTKEGYRFGSIISDMTERRSAAEALRASEERLSLAKAAGGIGIWDLDLISKQLLWDERMCEIYGIEPGAFGGTYEAWEDFVLPDNIESFRSNIQGALTDSGDLHTEFQILRSDGTRCHIEGHATVVRSPEGAALRMIGLNIDITARRKTEQELEEARALLMAAIAQSPAGIIVADAPDGRIRSCNPAALGIRGTTEVGLTEIPIEMHPQNWQVFYPDGRPVSPEDLPLSQAVLYGKASISQEFIIRRGDGEDRHVLATASPIRDSQGQVVAGIVMFPDITEHKRAQEALKASEERYRVFLENLPVGVYQNTLEPNGHFLSANRAMAKMFGFDSVEQLMSVPVRELYMVPEERARVLDEILREGGISGREVRLRHRDGSELWGAVWAHVERDATGHPSLFFGVLEDITLRKRMEALVRENEQRLASILQGSPIPAFVIDRNHRILYWNAALEELTGIKAADVLQTNRHWSAFYRMERPCLIDLLIDGCLADVSNWYLDQWKRSELIADAYESTLFIPLLGQNGKWLQFTAAVIRDGSGSPMWGVETLVDITESRKASELLSLNARRMQLLLRLNQMGEASLAEITSFALEASLELTGSEIGYLAFLNEDESILRMHAWSRTAMAQCMIEDKPLDYAVVDTGLWGEAVRQRRPVITNDYQAPSPWKKGYPEGHVAVVRHMNVPIFSGNRIVIVAGVGNKGDPYDDGDVDQLRLLMEGMYHLLERKRTQEALQSSETKYRDLVQNASSIILRMDIRGHITFFNEFARTFFGYTEEEVIGRDVVGTIVSELAPEDWSGPSLLACADIGPDDYKATETENVRKNGERVWVAWTRKPLRDADGHVAEILCVGNDITEMKRMEGQLRQAQKMEAVGQLAGGVAHDFNNLLQAILGYAELLSGQMEPQDALLSEVHEIQRAAERAAGLTRQLLAFSRRQLMNPQSLDLNAVVGDLLKMIGRVIGEHIQLDFLPGFALGKVHADCGQLEQVVMNLCLNARDAMPNGGRLLLETENVLINESYVETHEWAKPGRYVLFSATDTGCGMSQDTLTRVFEPFFTTKEVGQGTGLGLATVYGIVKQHNGLIHVYSEIDKGTTFKIYLPAIERAATSTGTKLMEPVTGGAELILLAEDEEQVRLLAKRFLERAGYTVLAAADGLEALDLCREYLDRLDLLVLDVVMPHMGGREVYDAILKERPDIPCLFCSGYSENAVHTNFVLESGLTLVQKPYRRDDLLRHVRQVLDARAPHPLVNAPENEARPGAGEDARP